MWIFQFGQLFFFLEFCTFTCFACSATSPSFAYMSNLALDSRLCAELLLPDCHGPLQLLLPISHLLLPDCVCFSFCSQIVSTSAAAPRLRLLQVLLPDCVHFRCLAKFQPLPSIHEHSQSLRFNIVSIDTIGMLRVTIV